MKHVLIALSLLVGAAPNMASAALPYENNFEAGGDGESIFSNEAYNTTWAGAGVAIITNLDYSSEIATTYMIPPLGGDHTKVMAFADGALSNLVNDPLLTPGTDEEMMQPIVVSIDTMIQPTFTQELTTDATLSNSQFAIAFTTNGNLALYHSAFEDETDKEDVTPSLQMWTEFSNGSVITSGKWIRLTVTIDYNATKSGIRDWRFDEMVKVAIDGIDQTAPNGLASNDIDAPSPGPWFVARKAGEVSYCHQMVLNGIGMIDDLTINTNSVSGGITSSNQVPFGWMIAMGVTNDVSDAAMSAAENEDNDLDGMLNWQEYIAGTHPTNEASKFMIISQVISNGFPRIRWLSSTAALAPYRVDSSTNLLGDNWLNETANVWAVEGGTNELVLPPPAGSPGFYRVQIVP